MSNGKVLSRSRTRSGAVATGNELGAGPAKPKGMSWRVAVSIVAFFGSLIAAILWLSFYAWNLNLYQNAAIVVVIVLAFIAVMGATWASWGIKQGVQ